MVWTSLIHEEPSAMLNFNNWDRMVVGILPQSERMTTTVELWMKLLPSIANMGLRMHYLVDMQEISSSHKVFLRYRHLWMRQIREVDGMEPALVKLLIVADVSAMLHDG
jgi:hypothetical protein